jgi:hypothetical protein
VTDEILYIVAGVDFLANDLDSASLVLAESRERRLRGNSGGLRAAEISMYFVESANLLAMHR